MKTIALFIGFLASSIGFAQAQQTAPDNSATRAANPALQITERGANHRVWSTVAWITNRAGIVTARTNAAYTELATGMHHLVNGQWVESSDAVEITATGGEATNCQHGVSFLGNLNSTGAVDIALPEGNHLTSSILGLSYFDTSTGDSVMIGQITNSDGQILPSGNRVLYPEAFSGISADVLYINSIHGVEQFVILREQPPSPAAYGLNPSTTMLEVITEFLNPPTPGVIETKCGGATDHQLCFGAMRMGSGAAFALGSETNKVRVMKQWLLMNGRRCLVEQVPLSLIQTQLQQLPAYSGSASLPLSPGSVIHHLAEQRPIPGRRFAVNGTSKLKIATTQPKEKGFVMDYTLSTSQTNFTFQGDSTYYVSGSINLRGTTVIEGGSVIKFTNDVYYLTLWDAVACKTSPYHPAVFTAKDDDSIGTSISGSTGTPSGYYCQGIDILMNQCALSNIRFSFAENAFIPEGPMTLTNCQFLNCDKVFEAAGDVPRVHLYNALIYSVGTVFNGGGDMAVDIEQTTIHLCNTLTLADDSGEDSSVSMTNCLLVGVTNWGNITPATNSTAYFATDDAGIFQTVGGGSHYLADGSPYRNAGTTNIDPGLLADIAQRTTYPPTVYSNVTLTANTTFALQAQRDTDTPDLGYHYDPLDYAFKWVFMTNATFEIGTGAAIGVFGTYGLNVCSGAQLISDGTPTTVNHIARYNLVQECANANWTGSGDLFQGNFKGGSVTARATFRFTDFSEPALDGYDFINASSYGTVLTAQDCQFHGGQIANDAYNLILTNCLFERVAFRMTDNASDLYPIVRNCTFFHGSLYADDFDGTTWTFRDNLFDQTSIAEPDTIVDAAYNAYVPGSERLTTNANDVVTNIVFQTGPLGNYYLTNTSPLINAGSIAANLVGLYEYTTQTNQWEEAASLVDMGFHYVAVDSSGNPIDLDGNGVADYLEDANGNGIPDWIEAGLGYSGAGAGQTNGLGNTQSGIGYGLFVAEPKGSSQLP